MERRSDRSLCTVLFLIAMASGSQAQDPIHRRYTTADGLASNTMYGMVQDHRGFLWFGTDAGASRFDGKYFVNYGLRDGLPDEEVLNLFEDSHHRMWMMLLNGKLAYVRNDTLYHPGNDPKLRSVTGRAGWARACEDRAGNIWFGGVWGELLMLDTLGGFHAIDTPNKGILQGQVTPLIDQNGDLFIQVNSQGFVMQDGILVHTFDFTIPGPTIMYARSPDGRWWSASTDGLLEIGRHPRRAASTFWGSLMGTTVFPSSGILSSLSSPYSRKASPHCLQLFKQEMACAFAFAFDNAGSSMAARMAMMAMTTKSSMSVKPRGLVGRNDESEHRM